MTDPRKQVSPYRMLSKAEVSGCVATGWARVTNGCKGHFAAELDIDPKTVNRALTCESLPSLDHALNSLAVDPTALDELFAKLGARIVPAEAKPATDYETISALADLVANFVKVMEDGVRDHNETILLAGLIRPLQSHLSAIVAEADRHRGIN